jgi:hypothetical protein
MKKDFQMENGRDEQKNFIYIDFRIASLKLHTKIFFSTFLFHSLAPNNPTLNARKSWKEEKYFFFILTVLQISFLLPHKK